MHVSTIFSCMVDIYLDQDQFDWPDTSLTLACSASDSNSISSTHPSMSSSISAPKPVSLFICCLSIASAVCCSSSSRSPARSHNPCSASSRSSSSHFLGTSNCFRIDLAMRLTIWRKHCVWLASENLGRIFASLVIMTLLHDALSHVILNIYSLVSRYMGFILLLTLSAIPNSSSIFANAIAKLRPE